MTWHWANDQTANNDNRRTFDSSPLSSATHIRPFSLTRSRPGFPRNFRGLPQCVPDRDSCRG